MNEIYALEPVGFGSFIEAKHALSHFYPYKGRLIVGLPRDWFEKVAAATANLGDLERKRIISMLEKINSEGCLLRPDFTEYAAGKSWRDNASKARLSEGIEALLLWNEEECDGVVTRYALDDLPDSSNAPIRMDVKSYMAILRPMLKTSREIFVVDPYLDPCGLRHQPFIDALFDSASKIAKTNFIFITQSIRGVSRVDLTDAGKCLSTSRRKAQGNYRVGFEFHQLDKDDLNQHGRFVFSIKFGLQFDRGFEVVNKKSPANALDGVNVVSVLSRKTHDLLLSAYLDAKPLYQDAGIVSR